MFNPDKVNIITQARAWQGEFPITGRYTYGVAGERFFREIKENGRIFGTRCAKCDIVYVPARMYCERCFAHLDEWVEVPPTGTVHTFTVLRLDLDDHPLEEPRVLAFVVLDGTDGGFVHYLGEVDPDDVYIGMEVEAVFKPKEEREGGITDILYFKPIG